MHASRAVTIVSRRDVKLHALNPVAIKRLSGVFRVKRVDGMPDTSDKQVDTLLWISGKTREWETFDSLLEIGADPNVSFCDSVSPASTASELWFDLLEANVGRTLMLRQLRKGTQRKKSI